ncbi:hypothetical protein [Desulfolithobacter sp.]
MKPFCLTLVVLFFSVTVPVLPQGQAVFAAQGDSGQQNGVLSDIFNIFGGVAREMVQESFDEWLGNYKGKIGQVRLVERRGNSIILEVAYENVKRADGVSVQAKVFRGGVPLDGFVSSVAPVTGRRGLVRLTISRPLHTQNEWGNASDWNESGFSDSAQTVFSDQIQLFLVRESNPDRPFGHLVFDFPKTWTTSSEIEIIEPEHPVQEEAVELEEGQVQETGSGSGPGTAIPGGKKPALRPVLPGTILKPVNPAVKPGVVQQPPRQIEEKQEKPVLQLPGVIGR